MDTPSGAYNLLEIYANRNGNLTAKTYYKTRKGVSQRLISLKNSLHSTPETTEATLSDTKIPQMFENSNIEGKNDVLFRDGDPEMRERKTLARARYEERVKSGGFQTKEALQDSMLALKDAMKAILGREFKTVEDVAWHENAYIGEKAIPHN